MPGESRGQPVYECPICFKRETPKRHDLLCGECVHDRIEIIRNSVVENEQSIQILRGHINAVFAACSAVRSGTVSDKDYEDMIGETAVQTQPDIIFSTTNRARSGKKAASAFWQVQAPRFLSVKHLALQLQKLDIVNTKAKIAGIQKTQSALEAKIAGMKDKIAQMSDKIEECESLVRAKRAQLLDTYTVRSDALDMDIFRMRGGRMKHVLRQSFKRQQWNFLVVKQVAFPNYDRWKASAARKKCVLELFSQPVIPIVLFSAYGRKLESLNTFLEQLIYLQVVVSDILQVTDPSLELPYLETLRNYIPDSAFFDLVQKKLSFLVEEPVSEDVPEQTCEEHQQETTPDKIVIRNNVIQVPISFRTVNLQRRLSVRDRADKGPDPGGNSASPVSTDDTVCAPMQNNQPGHTEAVRATARNMSRDSSRDTSTPAAVHTGGPKPPASDSVSPRSRPEANAGTRAKQIVIVPHRILTKPFARMSVDEYLRFLLVVVKILLNFHALLAHTMDKVQSSMLRREASRNLLATTINHLRFSGGLVSTIGEPEPDSDPDYSCDIERILGRLAELDIYLKHTEQEQIRLTDRDRLVSATDVALTPHLSHSTLSRLEEPEIAETVKKTEKPPPSRLRGIYDTFFRKQPPVLLPTVDDRVYGLMSETSLEGEESQADEQPQKGNRPDPKTMMNSVHQLIVAGHGHFRGHTEPAFLATQSMLAESSHHMDDWDVLSRLY